MRVRSENKQNFVLRKDHEFQVFIGANFHIFSLSNFIISTHFIHSKCNLKHKRVCTSRTYRWSYGTEFENVISERKQRCCSFNWKQQIWKGFITIVLLRKLNLEIWLICEQVFLVYFGYSLSLKWNSFIRIVALKLQKRINPHTRKNNISHTIGLI